MPGVNYTIDDANGDEQTGQRPVYVPADSWNDGASCSKCFVKPDSSKVFEGTWKDTTQFANETNTPHTVTVSFNGTAAYVYAIIDDNLSAYTTRTDLLFSIDGEEVGSYIHDPSGLSPGDGFIYNVPVYVNTSLADRQHTLVVSTNIERDSSLFLFDRIEYTSNNTNSKASPSALAGPVVTSAHATPPVIASSSKSSSVPVLPIAIGITLGLVFLLILALVFLLIRNRQRERAQHYRPSDLDYAPPMSKAYTSSAPATAYTATGSASPINPGFVVTSPTPIIKVDKGKGRAIDVESSDDRHYVKVSHSKNSSSARPQSMLSDATTASFYPTSTMFGTPPDDIAPPMPMPNSMIRQGAYDPNDRVFK